MRKIKLQGKSNLFYWKENTSLQKHDTINGKSGMVQVLSSSVNTNRLHGIPMVWYTTQCFCIGKICVHVYIYNYDTLEYTLNKSS